MSSSNFTSQSTDDFNFDMDSQNSILTKLQRAMKNEKVAPEILPYKSNLVNIVSQQIKESKQLLSQVQLNSINDTFLTHIYQMDTERCQYLLISYLRIRLQKLEKNAIYYLKEESMKERMSENELHYLEEYFECKGNYLIQSLDGISERYKGIAVTGQNDRDNMITQPNLNIYVYCRILEQIDNFLPSQTQSSSFRDGILLEKGKQYILLYSDIKDYVYQDMIELF